MCKLPLVLTSDCPAQILTNILSERLGSNPMYSLRAFARDIGLYPQHLSQLLKGKKGISLETASSIAERLSFAPHEKIFFLELVQSKFSRSKALRKVSEVKVSSLRQNQENAHHLSVDAFRVVSDWYHFAIIELLKLPASKGKSAKHFARQLGLAEMEANEAIKRLLRLELVVQTKKGFKVAHSTLFTSDGVPSEALRKFHKQVLEKAMTAISNQSIHERYLSTSILAVRKQDYLEASKMIAAFRSKFSQNMTKQPGDEIYALSIQYFKLTESEKG